jgi:ABC-type glycerol-3-phosphate transport system substrate-binding protein
MIPFSNDLQPIKAAFGVNNETYVKEDGTLAYSYTHENYKKYVEYMAKLYKDGILNQEFGTDSTTTLNELVISERLYSLGGGWATIIGTFNQKPENLTTDQFKYLPQMTMDAETPAILGDTVPVQLFAAVPAKKTDKFDLACEFINYMASVEGKKVQDYGIEGIDYQVDAEGKIVQTLDEQNAVGWKICYEILATAPSFYVRLYAKGFDWSFNGVLASREASNCVVVRDPVKFMPTSEEYVEIKQELGVSDYVNEQTTLFIIGQRDVATEWDAFMAEVEDRGLSEQTEALNEWYDLYK